MDLRIHAIASMDRTRALLESNSFIRMIQSQCQNDLNTDISQVMSFNILTHLDVLPLVLPSPFDSHCPRERES